MDTALARVLIVEDDDQLAALLEEYLGMHGFALWRAASGDEGVARIMELQPDLVILDLMLPGANGLDVCRRVRPGYSGAILMLTASQSEADHVAGLELGADDFVHKPIEPRVLLARIRSQLRRRVGRRHAEAEASSSDVLDIGTLRITPSLRDASVGGREVVLTAMEFDILHMLAREAGTVVRRDDLYSQVMGIAYDGIDRGVDVHLSRIRRKLEQAGFDTRMLKSIRGVGYLLVGG
jgi:DNA-binding response OmpR family regulator